MKIPDYMEHQESINTTNELDDYNVRMTFPLSLMMIANHNPQTKTNRINYSMSKGKVSNHYI